MQGHPCFQISSADFVPKVLAEFLYMASLWPIFNFRMAKNRLVLILFQHEGVHCNTVRHNLRLADTTYYGRLPTWW
jgi:hypothetical protein